ncbi:hypothetical protein ABFT80_04015 [Mesorhizobium sp. SB112]|uniref:hypothetical protein n=1 Tax=Mesorhizobium sp. SB112 TaxID=3151853 RepID=UPI0032679EC7
MQDDPIEELQALIERLWARTGLGNCVQIARSRQDDGSAHVEVVVDRYDLVITERGNDLDRIAGLSVSDAARWFLMGMAERHAQKAELQNRVAPEDASPLLSGIDDDGYSRWNWMAPAIETMSRISPQLGDWMIQEYEVVLRRAPLADYERRNARYPLPPAFK